MHRLAMIGLSLVALLSLAAAAEAQFSRDTTPVPAARAYLCFEGNSADDITQKANAAGAKGWKMVTAAAGRTGSVWCFEQFMAARPQKD